MPLVIAVSGIVVIATSVFILTLPPPLTSSVGSATGTISGDFPTIFSNASLNFSFNATTLVKQNQGPPSSLALHVGGYTYWVANPFNHSRGELVTWFKVTVTGHFASNLRPWQVQVGCNGTGVDTFADAWTSDEYGTNVSFDHNHQIGFHDNGGDSLVVGLTNQNGAGPYHDFDFHTVIELDQWRGYQAFIGFRATVTGWMLPPISVNLLLQTVYTHKTVTLFPAHQNWTVAPGGSQAAEFGVYTAYTFAVGASFTASAPVTAYIVDLPTYLALPNSGIPTTWNWTSGPGVTSTSVSAIFPSEWGYVDPYPWYFVFVNSDPQRSVTVTAVQAVTATI